jgi:hypothetical protein
VTKPKKNRINERWENGVPHDPRSEKIYEKLAKLDYEECDDSFCFKSGGDGDNGETLMYLLDLMFEDEDERSLQSGPTGKAV